MGAGYSADKGGPLAELSSSWVLKYADSATKYASGSSLCVIKRGEWPKQLALCYQASDAAVEGSRQQHLRFALSKDGENFGPSKCVMWGPAPLWNPTMHYDAGKPGPGGAWAALRAGCCQCGRVGNTHTAHVLLARAPVFG